MCISILKEPAETEREGGWVGRKEGERNIVDIIYIDNHGQSHVHYLAIDNIYMYMYLYPIDII